MSCFRGPDEEWALGYETTFGLFQHEDIEPQYDRNEADARTKMLICLIENKLITTPSTTVPDPQ